MESELTEASNINSKNDNSAVTEEENIDEAITAKTKASNNMEKFLKKNQNTQAYKDTTTIHIENNKILEKRNKVYTTQWRKIYEVI